MFQSLAAINTFSAITVYYNIKLLDSKAGNQFITPNLGCQYFVFFITGNFDNIYIVR